MGNKYNGHGINLYGVIMTLMDILHAGGQSNLGYLSLLHRAAIDSVNLATCLYINYIRTLSSL